MNLLICILRWLFIAWIDWLFKSRRVVRWTDEGLLYRDWPPFWMDQGILCWRGVLALLALGCIGYDIYAGAYLRAVMMALTFNLEFRFYWYWMRPMELLGFEAQEQNFRFRRYDGPLVHWRKPNWFELPADPRWLRIWGINLRWYHTDKMTIAVLVICAGLECIAKGVMM